MGNSASLYDVRLDGARVTDIPKPVIESLQAFMTGHETLIVIRKPERINEPVNNDNKFAVTNEALLQLTDKLNAQRDEAMNTFLSSIEALNIGMKEINESMKHIDNQPQFDIKLINNALESLTGRLNDMSNALPLTIQDKLDRQVNHLSEVITNTIKPKDSENASIKGAAYELEVTRQFEALNIPSISIERISNTKDHSCDIHVMDNDNNILFAVECKNYTTSVGTKEVDKFYDDLKSLKESENFKDKTVIGMFLSKQTSIVKHGYVDIDEHGNIFLASKYNNPLMWHAAMRYAARIVAGKRQNKSTPDVNENDNHKEMLFNVYSAMKDMEGFAEIIAKNIKRVDETLKDLKSMAERIKPIPEIVDQFASLYGFSKVPSKPKIQRKPKKDIEKSTDNEQLDIEPIPIGFGDSDEEDAIEVPAKRRYNKRKEKKVIDAQIPLNRIYGTIGWDDD